MSEPTFHPDKPIPILLSTAEVVGKGDIINGVFGGSKEQIGVIGQSEKSIGVFGDGEQEGVFGISTNGIGVHGKGGRLAGLFEGKVEATESLTVQGIDLISLIRQLQQRIDELEQQSANTGQLVQRVSALEQAVNGLTQSVSALFTLVQKP